MRYLTISEVLEIHDRLIRQSGGASGLRDLGALELSVAQPRMTFDGGDLYPTISEKASALGFSLIQNHPFVDGNKRTGHAAAEIFLVMNGYQINAHVDEQENVILLVVAGEIGRASFSDWLRNHIQTM